MRSQKVTDILRLLLTDERIPDNLITVFYTDVGEEAKKPLTDFHYDPVLGLNISTLGLRDYQITCIKLLDKVVWDKIGGVDLISTSSPPSIYSLLGSTSQEASLATVDRLPVAGSKVPEHLRRLCAIQASKPGFRKHRFFICQRVYNEAMIEKAVNMQAKICEKVPLLKESCYPPGWLHVTLATVCPSGPEELHLAIRLLQRMIDKYYYESYPQLTFSHPNQFADFVIVFRANISDSINEAICSAFQGDGIEIDDHEFNPHLTVIKPPSNVARKLSGRLRVDQYHARIDTRSTDQLIDCLEVCMCGQERDEEGFWLRAASLPLAPDENL